MKLESAYHNLKAFIIPSEKVDFYLCMPILTETLYSRLTELIQQSKNTQSRYFIVFPTVVTAHMKKGIDHLIGIASSISNLYIMQQDVKSFLMISNKTIDSFYIELKDAKINDILINIAVKSKFDIKADKYEKYLLYNFSNELASLLCSKANEIMDSNMEILTTKDQLDKLFEIEFKILPFVNNGDQAHVVKATLERISIFKTERISLLNEHIKFQLKDLINSIKEVTETKEIPNLERSLDALNSQVVESEEILSPYFAEAKIILEEQKEKIEEQKRTYSFIIDTNILLIDPEVILRVDKKHAIIIAAKVLDELDKFKMDKTLSANVSKAVKIIQQDRNRNIRHNKGRPKLLPPDLNQKTPDNLILSVAIQYQNNHGILVTSDNLLSVKAQNVLDLKVLNLQEFKTKFDHPIKD